MKDENIYPIFDRMLSRKDKRSAVGTTGSYAVADGT